MAQGNKDETMNTLSPADPFKALLLTQEEGEEGKVTNAAITEIGASDLMEGEVLVEVSYSCLNYKDGLAITGAAPVVRRWPMVAGIDFVGTVVESDDPAYKSGDAVIGTGWGMGETHLGAYATYTRVPAKFLVPKPTSLTEVQTMAIGTAGYTSMLCVQALEKAGIAPESGPVLVTGAAGGVGSVAVSILAKLGYEVLAVTGRVELGGFLTGLGAKEVLSREDMAAAKGPMGKERWAGAIDVAGGDTLAQVIAQTAYGGAVAACGLADSLGLKTTVAPFILRNVSLLGVDSVMTRYETRLTAWDRLAHDLPKDALDSATSLVPVRDIVPLAQAILDGSVKGRTVVQVKDGF